MAFDYPKYKYGKGPSGGLTSKLVSNEAEEKKLGAGWYDNPMEAGFETHPGAADVKTIPAKVVPPKTAAPEPKAATPAAKPAA